MTASKSETVNKSKWYKMTFYETLVTGALAVIIGLMFQLVADNASTKQRVINNTSLIRQIELEHGRRIDELNQSIKKFYQDFYKRTAILIDPKSTIPFEPNFSIPMNTFFGPTRKEYDRRGLRMGKDFRHRIRLEGRKSALLKFPNEYY